MQNKSAYIWSLAGRILPQSIYLVTTMILARYLSPEDFGVLGILSIFLMVANTLLDAGFGGSLVNEKYLSNEDCSTVFTFSFVTSLTLYGGMFFIAPYLETFYAVIGLTKIVRILCLIFVIQAFTIVPSSILVKQLKFQRLTIIRIVAVISASILSVLYALYYQNVYALIIYQLVQSIVIAISVNYKPQYKVGLKFRKDSFKRLFSFGLYTTLANTVDTIYENLLALIFGKALSVQQAGYLSQAKRIEEISTQTVTQTINSTSFPILSKKKENLTEFEMEADSIFKFSIYMITPLMLILSLYSEEIITLLFGSQWTEAAPYLSQLSFAGIFIIMQTLNRTFIKSLGAVTELFRISLYKRGLGVLILFGCLIIDIRFVMYGYIASSILAYIINQYVYCKHISVGFIKSVIDAVIVLIPSIIFFMINTVLVSVLHNHIQILTTAILLSFYYLYVYLKLKNRMK